MIKSHLCLAIVLSTCIYTAHASASSADTTDSDRAVAASILYLKGRLDSPLKLSKLKPGDQVSGKLVQDVYRGGVAVFPASSAVRLTVDQLERRRRAPNDHWPWMIKAFSPRHERWPTFHVASVTKVDGTQV